MALHNSWTRLSSILRPLFLQLPHSSLSTLQFFKEHQGKQKALKICFPHHQKHADLKRAQNGAKPASQTKWSDQQTSVLVEEWKERLDGAESRKSLEARQKIVQAVNKARPPKTMKQCKDKLQNLKQAYKDANGKNSQTGHGAN